MSTADGRQYSLRADGTLRTFRSGLPSGIVNQPAASLPSASLSRRGGVYSASFRPDGKIVSLHTGGPNGINIQHGARGWRVITVHRADQSTLVSTGRRSGYLEKTIDRDGRTLVERTYLSGDRSWRRFYDGSVQQPRNSASLRPAGGNEPIRVVYKQYLPHYRYQPAFYNWANRGWDPINYHWKWTSHRWFAYYGSYFYPWASYPDGSFWLTDYILGQTLADSYDMQQPDTGSVLADADSDATLDNAPAYTGQQSGDETVYAPYSTAIPSSVKQEIAAEVHRQLELESAADSETGSTQPEAPGDPAQFMQPGHIFIVSTPIQASVYWEGTQLTTELTGQQCSLTPGDVLRLYSIPSPIRGASTDSSNFNGNVYSGELEVVSSQRADCPVGVHVMLTTVALQEMENNFQAHLDDGLHMLYSQQDKDGLPAAPSTTVTEQPASADPASSAASLGAELQSLQTQANRAEAQVTQTLQSAQTDSNQP
ncbi:MAG: hypothetical protein ABR991_10210 [Terracidiphilus sp.]